MANPPSQEPPSSALPELPVTAKLWTGVSVGDVLGNRFKIVAPISSGGTAMVYECEDLHLRAPAAVKILTDPREDTRLRFLDEGRILANLKSPHLVQVLAVGELTPGNSDDPSTPYMALELLPGRSLEQRLRQEGPLPWRQVAELLGQVASALADMHHVGVIHRDIKPGNLVEVGSMMRRGSSKSWTWASPRLKTGRSSTPPASPRRPGTRPRRTSSLVHPASWRPRRNTFLPTGASALAVLMDDRIATAEAFGQRLEDVRVGYADESEPCLFAGCFELLQPLGIGAKGIVYKAYNHDAPSYVAIKLLSEQSKANPEEHARFAREAQVLKAVRHAALPEIYECRTSEKQRRPYIAMSLAPGRSAGEFCIGKNLLPAAEVIDVGKCLAGALAALHARGIIHRDVSTSNVVIDRVPKMTTATLIDVGMAELDEKFYAVVDQRYHPRPTERVKLGTGGLEQFDWTAPEAKVSCVWTDKSDVWSLGLLLHKLLTGKRPATNKAGALLSPREFQPRCPHTLASAVLSALNPDPDKRVDAAELLELLELAADELAEETGAVSSAITAEPKRAPPMPVAPTSPSRQPARTWTHAGVVALAAVVLLALVWRGGDGDTADGVAPNAAASTSPPTSATQAAVVEPSPPTPSVPRPPKHEPLLASSDLPKPMREALAGAAAELRRCSGLAGGLLVVQFTTAEHSDKFADVAVHSRTDPAVDRCVRDAAGPQSQQSCRLGRTGQLIKTVGREQELKREYRSNRENRRI